MKKQRVKLLFLAAAGAVALAIVAALSWPPRPVPAFRFLQCEPTELRSEADGDTFAVYRLEEGDFNEVCAEAVTELTDLGFHEVPGSIVQNNLQGSGVAKIYKEARMFARGGPNDSLWAFIGETDDGVVVSVQRTRHPFDIRNWPRYLLWRIRSRKQLESQRVRPEPGTEARRH